MPHTWERQDQGAPEKSGAFCYADGDPPAARLTLWPHRSLTARGFVWFVGGTAVAVSLPLLAVLGSPVLWGLLPFMLLTIGGIWWALDRNTRDGALTEELTLWRDRMDLVRRDPRGVRQEWTADPYWVRVELHETGGPVEKYLTLKGGNREVEIGAFLSPDERVALRAELADALARLR